MIDLHAPSDSEVPVPYDPLSLPARTDEELDVLPFGVIGLSSDGRVARYNLAESRLARLDRAQVLGRRFFGEVAPCTATPEFEGRVQRFAVEDGAALLKFQYVFDFQFGAQDVEVEVMRGDAHVPIYLVINRHRFLSARLGLPPGFAAPLQRELAPDEAAAGVLRDGQARRVVQVTPPFFAALRSTWQRVAPEGWPLFCLEWGVRWGRRIVVDLETEALEETGQGLGALPLRVVMVRFAAWLRREGWGELQADFSSASRGAIVVRLRRGALAESLGEAGGEAQCQLLAGLFKALFSHLAGKLLVAREQACACQGADRCTFVIVGQPRRPALEAALARPGASLPSVIEELARHG